MKYTISSVMLMKRIIDVMLMENQAYQTTDARGTVEH